MYCRHKATDCNALTNSCSSLELILYFWNFECLSYVLDAPIKNSPPEKLLYFNTRTHTQPFYGCLDFVRDNPGELVPEDTFTHSHLSWSSVIPYLLSPSVLIHGILPVQLTYFNNGRLYIWVFTWHILQIFLKQLIWFIGNNSFKFKAHFFKWTCSCTFSVCKIVNNESNFAQLSINSSNVSAINVSCPLTVFEMPTNWSNTRWKYVVKWYGSLLMNSCDKFHISDKAAFSSAMLCISDISRVTLCPCNRA